jgi:hypothetical protein
MVVYDGGVRLIPDISAVPLTDTPFYINSEEKKEYDRLPRDSRDQWLERRQMGGMLVLDDQWAEEWEKGSYEGSAMQTNGRRSIFMKKNGDGYILQSQVSNAVVLV